MQSPQDSEASIHPRTAADPQGSLAPWSTEDLRAEIARRAEAEEAQPLRFHAGTLGELRFRAGDLQRLLEADPTGIFIRLDLQAPEITMNPAGARMLGSVPTSDTLAKGTSDNVPPVPRFRNGREVPPDELPMQRAIREGVTVSDERYTVRRPDGSTLEVLESASPLRDEEGKIRGILVVFIDVTELIRGEDALRESEQRLKFLANAVPALIISVTSDQRFELVNRTFLEWFGISPEQAHGHPVADVVGTETWREIRPDLERALRGEHVTFEKQLRYPDATRRWVRVHYTPDRDAEGHVRRVAVLGTDIEDSKRVEDALRRSEAEFRAIFDLAGAGIAQICAKTGRFLRVNRRFCEIAGCDETKLVTMRYTELTHPDDRKEDEVVSEVLRGEREGWVVEKRLVHEATAAWVLSCGSLIREEGRPAVAVESILDVTPRKLAEEALARSQAMLAQSQRVARIGSWELDLGRLEDLDANALRWSEETYRLFGLDPRETTITNEMFFALVHSDDRPAVAAAIRAALDARTPYEIEHRIVLPDGEERTIHEWGTIVSDESGRPTRVLGTCQDVTERTRLLRERAELLEAERSARAEAERASRSKDEFLATLGHELRTPLNAILGWTYVLRKTPGTPRPVVEGIDVIERNARTQAKLVGDLLDLHGIASGKLRLEIHDVDLASIVSMAVAAIRPTAEARGLALTYSGVFSGMVRGDPDRLQQVVSNLLANSVKFTPSGGSIRVIVARKDPWAVITVSDTGRGISRELLTEIFERFRQADTSTTRKHGGLGIGLALVRQLVALHGGRVRAESEGEGRGSTFIVELPIAVATEHAAADTGARSTEITGSRVLVVDDEPDGLEATRLLLEESGALVATASSAAEALDRLERQDFDAILSDIGMPDIDGYAFMTEVRRRGIDTPAGALTALTRIEDRRRAFEAGYSAHVPKPIDPPTLLATVRSLAGQR